MSAAAQIHVQRVLGAARPPVVRRAAVAGGDDDLAAVVLLDGLQHAHQRRFQAGNVDAVGLREKAVGRKPGKAGGRSEADRRGLLVLMQVDVAVVVDAGLALDFEQRGLAHARQRIEVFLVFAAVSDAVDYGLAVGAGRGELDDRFRLRGSGTTSGAAWSWRRAEQRGKQAALLRGRAAARRSQDRLPSHRPDYRVPASLRLAGLSAGSGTASAVAAAALCACASEAAAGAA